MPPGGLPCDPIREVHFRYAKELMAAGSAAGADSYLGMPWELVAQDNPLTGAQGSALRIELRFKGEPAPDEAVHVFIRAPDGTAANQRLRTDAAGVATVAYAGPGPYMVNAIHILPASRRIQALLGATWQSL